MVGGTISSALLTLVVLPVSYYWAGAVRSWLVRRHRVPTGARGPDDEAGDGVTGS